MTASYTSKVRGFARPLTSTFVLARLALLFSALNWLPLRSQAQTNPYQASIGGNQSISVPHNPISNTAATFGTASFVTIQNNSQSNATFKIITEIALYDSNGDEIARTQGSSTVTVGPGQTHATGHNGSTTANVGSPGEKKAKARQKVSTDTNQDVTDWIEFTAIEAPFVVLASGGGGNQNQE